MKEKTIRWHTDCHGLNTAWMATDCTRRHRPPIVCGVSGHGLYKAWHTDCISCGSCAVSAASDLTRKLTKKQQQQNNKWITTDITWHHRWQNVRRIASYRLYMASPATRHGWYASMSSLNGLIVRMPLFIHSAASDTITSSHSSPTCSITSLMTSGKEYASISTYVLYVWLQSMTLFLKIANQPKIR